VNIYRIRKICRSHWRMGKACGALRKKGTFWTYRTPRAWNSQIEAV